MTRPDVRIKRVYDDPASSDGQRVLVDRIWPRGMSKERAQLDEWCKEVPPSTDLRKWYDHDPDKWDEFTRRYRKELKDADRAAALDGLRKRAKKGRLTLLTASKALDISQAAALRDLIAGVG